MVTMRVIFIVGCLLAAVEAQGCPQSWYPKDYQCPQDCGLEEQGNCIRCTCGGEVVPAEPPSCYPADKYICPPFCGTNPEIVDEFGCVSCTCGAPPILICSPLTEQDCPGDCPRLTDGDGCETCDCPKGCPQSWYPKHYQCPQDCGREEQGNCIRCTCGATPIPIGCSKPWYPKEYQCPQDCGREMNVGCIRCTCGEEVVPAEPPFCYSEADYACPPEPFCGFEITNGCVRCKCDDVPSPI